MTGSSAESPFALRLPDGTVQRGPVVDLREGAVGTALSLHRLRRAIRDGRPTGPEAPAVSSPPPGATHAHVARLAFDTRIRTRAALAAVAFDRGVETPHDDDLLEAARSLRSHSPAPIDDGELRDARRKAAEAGAETDRLRERVATVRGRVTALREAAADDARRSPETDEGVADAETALSDATRRLSEAATERVAATQRLKLLEAQARNARDGRNTRISLEDRLENCRRKVRAARVDAVSDEFHAARRETVRRVHGLDEAASDALPTDVPEFVDALAVARIAPIRAPVVVAGDVVGAFGGADAAFEWLDAPLVIC
ncbi:DUF7856 family protein [Halobellus captivus]|uniref:DUF7856 family protein n=1 Tax=Halobellus captivus TaxID=2592614 RepID=UPI0011A6D80E|nr:hypothetical protein [Halobellus captivus]